MQNKSIKEKTNGGQTNTSRLHNMLPKENNGPMIKLNRKSENNSRQRKM